MHSIIDQLVPPNVINYSRKFSVNVVGKRQEMLACVKTNLIEVYTVDAKLTLFSKHTFAARIESIEVLSKPELESDWILMTFPDCKVKKKL